jgi:hypothetical protein
MPEPKCDPKLYVHPCAPEHRRIKDWKQVDEVRKLPADLVERIGRREIKCPACDDRGHYFITFESASTGKWYNVDYPCHCGFFKEFFYQFLRVIPAHYQYANLKTLEPSERSMLPLDYQADLLKEMREHPDDSYAFFGPAGTSKTTFSAALYRRALFTDMRERYIKGEPLFTNTACWRVTVKQLTDEAVAFATFREFKDEDGLLHRAKEPTVSRRKIVAVKQKGHRPRLFLEEIDKMKGSEFKQQELFDVLNGLYEADGQLVMNTNMTPEEFSNEFGAAFERRIAEMCRMKDFFGVTV